MKFLRCICYFFLFLVISSCHWKDSYVVHGKLRCVRAEMAYMMELDPLGTPIVVDSVPIHAGEFRFRGHVDYPTMRFIRIGTRAPFDVFVENSQITVSGSLLLPDEIKVIGSYSHDDFTYLSLEQKKIQNKQNTVLVHLSNAKKQNNQKKVARLNRIYNSYPDSLLQMTRQFVQANPSSMGAVYFVCSLAQTYDINRLEDIIGLFDVTIQKAPYVQYLKEELALGRELKVGMEAPNFVLPTFLGDTVTLSDYEGEYLFLDFGASWCDKTETRIDRLSKIYDDFEDKGFDVLTIALDEDRNVWRNYIATDIGVLPWRQACDFLYWSSPVTKYYGVHAIPYGVLISPEGKVSLINPSISSLESYLKKKLKGTSIN